MTEAEFRPPIKRKLHNPRSNVQRMIGIHLNLIIHRFCRVRL